MRLRASSRTDRSKQADRRSVGDREAGSLPRVGRFCVRRWGKLPDRRRGRRPFRPWAPEPRCRDFWPFVPRPGLARALRGSERSDEVLRAGEGAVRRRLAYVAARASLAAPTPNLRFWTMFVPRRGAPTVPSRRLKETVARSKHLRDLTGRPCPRRGQLSMLLPADAAPRLAAARTRSSSVPSRPSCQGGDRGRSERRRHGSEDPVDETGIR